MARARGRSATVDMTIFLESPWPAIAIGVALELLLAFALVQTGKGKLIAVMVVVALATVGLVVVERMIVTPREEVEDFLYETARLLETNNPPAVLARFSALSPRRNEAQS